MRDLEERPLHDGDFSYEDITGQDEPPVDSPPTQGESTATGPPGPDGEGQVVVRNILHSLAWCATSATAQGGKDEPIVTCRET